MFIPPQLYQHVVFVVEGKTDVGLLQQLMPNCATITTNGSRFDRHCLQLIASAKRNHVVVLALDPDYQGRQIQAKILAKIPDCVVLDVSFSDVVPDSIKCGLAECDRQVLGAKILQCLMRIKHPNLIPLTPITWTQYLRLELNSFQKRLMLCNRLKIPYFNHKQLFKKLVILQYSYEQLCTIIQQIS